MNTILLTNQNTVTLEEREMPVPRCGEIVIAVARCGICRTDRKACLDGQRDLVLPRVLGHEFAGTVAAIGEEVTGYQPGDRVNVHPGIGCGECEDCKNGNDQRCRNMKIFGFHLDGGFSRWCVIPEEGVKQGIVRKLPDEVSFEEAALCEPLGCASHMLDMAGVPKDGSILIAGGGVLGLMTATLARYYGAGEIIISEPVDEKRIRCKKMGFTVTSPEDMCSFVQDKYPCGVDEAIPCCPYSSAFSDSVSLLKNGGTLGFFSGLIDDSTINRNTVNLIHYKELTVKGTYGVGSKDTAKALKLLSEGFSLPAGLITLIGPAEAEKTLKQRETADRMVTMLKW